MCGISGIVRQNQDPIALETLQRMATCLKHRGPDDEGFWQSPGVGFGFRRLSIIDLSRGHQPMVSPDGRYALIFNGEIYNFQNLRSDLEKTGRHRFVTLSDTEVLLHTLIEYGEAGLTQLRGMFALAFYDRQDHSLLLARDRFGKKPLMYADLSGEFVFSSEIQSLLKHPRISKEIDYQALDFYLSLQYVPSPRTIFKQIRKVPPAHYLVYKKGEIHLKRYWDLLYAPKLTISWEDAQREMMERLRESVRLRMISDVPLGAFLSGGKDSSIVVGLMSELSKQPVKTFSIGFEDAHFSELPYAKTVAERFGTDHHEFVVQPDAIHVLPLLARHYGEPFADSSALPSYYVAKMTRQHVTVALNGDGGDELFAGYPRYQAMKAVALYTKLPLTLRKTLFALIQTVPEGPPPHSTAWRVKRLLGLGLRHVEDTYLDTLSFFKEDHKEHLLADAVREARQPGAAPAYINHCIEHAKGTEGIEKFLSADLHSYLPECLMVKMDIATMANSLEARSPFLDHEFAEWVAKLPASWKLKGFTHPKHLLTEATRGWLPKQITTRAKQGFAVPMSRWLKGPLKSHLEDMLSPARIVQRGLFKPDQVARLLEENANGRIDHSYRLWALLMLEHWFQEIMDGA